MDEETVVETIIGDLHIRLTREADGQDQLLIGKGADAIDPETPMVILGIDWAQVKADGVIMGA